MKELLQRMKDALNTLNELDLELIEKSEVFNQSAIQQITRHIEYVADLKAEIEANRTN